MTVPLKAFDIQSFKTMLKATNKAPKVAIKELRSVPKSLDAAKTATIKKLTALTRDVTKLTTALSIFDFFSNLDRALLKNFISGNPINKINAKAITLGR